MSVSEAPNLDHITYDHTGKTAVVTGASTGIGRAIGLALAKAGAAVVIDYLDDTARAENVVKEIVEAGGRALAVQADVSRPDEVRRLFSRAGDLTGGVDILVNNASVEVNQLIWEMDDDEWRGVIANSLDSAFYCSKYVLPYMIPRGGGKIINISSIHDSVPRAQASSYCVSKAGLLMLTRVLSIELAPYNIQVNAVSPGAVVTERTLHLAAVAKNKGLRGRVRNANPYKRLGVVDEVVEPVLYLCSPFSSYTSGTTLYVDGAYRNNLCPGLPGDALPFLDGLREDSE